MDSILPSKSTIYENSSNDGAFQSDVILPTTINKINGSHNNSSSNLAALKFASAICKYESTSNGQSHQLVSANSFELNGMTTSSLSEDSGLPPTTNSSISSGDSSRFGMCKSAFEVAFGSISR